MFNINFADDWIWTAYGSDTGNNRSTNWATTTAHVSSNIKT